MTNEQNNGAQIGHLNETSLHSDLIKICKQPGDLCETKVDGYVVDLLRADTIIEIQTRSFGSLKRKITRLLENYRLHIIYPLPVEKWIVKITPDSRIISRRKSPRRGRIEDIFYELVWLVRQVAHPNFSLEVLFITEDEIRMDDGKGSWRRGGWSIIDRKLVELHSSRTFTNAQSYRSLLPPSLPEHFSINDLYQMLHVSKRLVYKMVYCLKQIGVLQPIEKRGRITLYRISTQELLNNDGPNL